MSQAPAQTSRFVSLRVKIALLVLGIVAGTACFTLVFVPARIDELATSLATQRAAAVAASLEIALSAGVEFDDKNAVSDVLGQLGGVEGVMYCVVLGHDGGQLGRFDAKAGVADTGAGAGAIELNEPIRTRDPKQNGRLLIGFSLARVRQERNASVLAIALASLALAVAGLLVGLALAARVARPIRELASVTSGILGSNDLRANVRVRASSDESGVLARSFSDLLAHLRDVLLRLRDVAAGLPLVGDRVASTARNVVDGADKVLLQVEETSAATASTLRSLENTSRSIATLDQGVNAAARAIAEMDRRSADVTTTLGNMVKAVDVATSAVEQVTRSIDDIAKAVATQDETTKAMLASIGAFDRSTGEIRDASAATAAAAAQTQTSARGGVDSIAKTIDGIHTIHDAARDASDEIRGLDQRMSEIHRIVAVIRDISEQVTLFALNAAIVSAQAGPAGDAFAVIGREIKALATRTATSASEIGSLIGDIQQRSDAARVAMERGMAAVERGLELGEQAATALSQIDRAAEDSVEKAELIASSTADQARGTAELAAALQRVAESMERISGNAAAQAKNNAAILGTAKQLTTLADVVARATAEQKKSAEHVRTEITSIQKIADSVRRAQGQQTGEAEQVRSAVVAIHSIALEEKRHAGELGSTIEELRERALHLEQQVRRFRLE